MPRSTAQRRTAALLMLERGGGGRAGARKGARVRGRLAAGGPLYLVLHFLELRLLPHDLDPVEVALLGRAQEVGGLFFVEVVVLLALLHHVDVIELIVLVLGHGIEVEGALCEA
jgi:hypothetical protein